MSKLDTLMNKMYGFAKFEDEDSFDACKDQLKALIAAEVIGEDVTQNERHWSNEDADWCGRGGTMIDTRCICDHLNAAKAEQRERLATL